MEPQFFSPEVRVSRNRNGAVPVSVALHAMAIAAAVFAAAAVPPEVLYTTHTAPIVLPVLPTAVRVVPVPPAPPKGDPKAVAPSRKRVTTPAAPTAPQAVVTAPSKVEDLEDIGDNEPDLPIGNGLPAGPPTTCLVDCGPGAGPGPGVTSGNDGPVRVHMGVDAPQRVHLVPPRYPAIAVHAGIEGDVIVDCVIAPDGNVREARVLRGNPLLQQAAVDAVRQWRYTRPRLNDTPISVLLTVTVHFRLHRR